MSVANTGATVMASFSSQCFPVRSLTRGYKKEDEGGAWLVAYRAEQRRRFKAVLCGSGDQQTTQITAHRKTKSAGAETDITEQDKPRKLDGFYLMKEFYVDDPADLCYIRISGRDLREVSETDFLMFDNVVHVDAGDNNLPFTAFRMFQALRELELPLNNISGSIGVDPSRDFQHLETLDLSYNRLTGEDILALGLLQNLKTLHLTGNEIKKLPVEMARTYRTITGITASGTIESQERRVRFPLLENLYLDQNELTDLSTFASLAGLKRLRYLNLEHNEITSVPHLRLLGARVRHEEKTKAHEATKQDETHSTQPGQSKEDQSTSQGSGNQTEGSEKETGAALADEVEEILSRKLLEVEEGSQEHIEKPDLRPRSSTLTEDPALLDDKYDPPLPFSSLLHLNLANNVIFEEEGLLALASWPILRELVIWGNPLTTAFKGDPPILSYQLGRLKGVRIFRQKPTTRPKPVVNLADSTRKVSEALPPVPRKRDQFMLEAPPKHESIAYVGPHAQPLPPIASAPPRRRRQEAVTPRQLATAPANPDSSWKDGTPAQHHPRATPHDRTNNSLSPCAMTTGSLQTEGETTKAETVDKDDVTRQPQAQGDKSKGKSEDGFFMTQIDDLENAEQTSKKEQEPDRHKSQTKKKKEDDRPFSVQTKYKGFEDLLDVDESDQDITIPTDIQGSVRALHYALRHPLVFTEEPQGFTYKERQTRGTRDAFPASRQKSQQSRVEEMGDILDRMRVRSKTTESNLDTVLKNYKKDPSFRKEYQEARKLLNEVQTKYNEVRVSSLKPTADACTLFGNSTNSDSPEETVSESAKSSPKIKISDRTLTSNDLKDVAMDLKKFKEKLDSRI